MSSEAISLDRETSTDSQTNPAEQATVTILGGPPNLFRQCNNAQYDDLLAAVSPDAYFITDPETTVNAVQQLQYELPTDDEVLYPGDSAAGEATHRRINGVDILVCPSVETLRDVRAYERDGVIDTSTETVILSNLLSIEMHKDRLETTLDGRDAYVDALQPDRLDGSYTHVSGTIDAGYCHNWDGLLVRGAGQPAGNQFLSLTITTDGDVVDETVDPGNLGLQAIAGVGPATADRLRDAGLSSVTAVAAASRDALVELDGIGDATAEKLHKSATALCDGTVVPTSDTPVPGSDPVFIDIETDGLNPTAVWLIGVKDGIDGNYMSFITTDPTEPGKAVKGFMMWFTANAYNRTVMAWNGWNFDFPVLREHIQQHCPEQLDKWKHASKRDPLRWARDLDNAVLPGRTNKLEHVAESLGWDGHETALSGAEVARQYRAWMDDPSDETELDWEKHKTYCRDDVNALEYIYTAMQDANRLETQQTEPSMDVEQETTQGSLFESY